MINIDAVTHSYRGYEYFFDSNLPISVINGYVIIKPGQKGYDVKDFTDAMIRCHGGITFDSKIYGSLNDIDLPENYRYIGFDTNHPGDYSPMRVKVRKQMKRENPAMFKYDPFTKPHHWTKPEVAQECKLIIDQLIKGDYDIYEAPF